MSSPNPATIYRRVFVSTIALGLLAAPLVADAQQPGKVTRTGVLANAPPIPLRSRVIGKHSGKGCASKAGSRARTSSLNTGGQRGAALLNYVQARRIVDLAAKNRLPASYPFREAVEAGELMAYAANAPDMFRRAATFVDNILKGAKPADLPVDAAHQVRTRHQSQDREGVGADHPPSILVRADQVIE